MKRRVAHSIWATLQRADILADMHSMLGDAEASLAELSADHIEKGSDNISDLRTCLSGLAPHGGTAARRSRKAVPSQIHSTTDLKRFPVWHPSPTAVNQAVWFLFCVIFPFPHIIWCRNTPSAYRWLVGAPRVTPSVYRCLVGAPRVQGLSPADRPRCLPGSGRG